MKKNGIFLLIMLILVYNSRTFGDNTIIKVKNIKFFGLKYESKYVIMQQVRSKITGDSIIVDVKSLQSALKKMPIIESFSIEKKNDLLMVNIHEKKPVILIGLKNGQNLALYEMDDKFNIIARNSVHISKPLLIIEKERLEQDQNNKELYNKIMLEKVKKFYLLCMQVREKLPLLYREMSEIYVQRGGESGKMIELEIRLHNRKPVFFMKAHMDDFVKLNYVAGFLDRNLYNPEKVKISGNKVVLR